MLQETDKNTHVHMEGKAGHKEAAAEKLDTKIWKQIYSETNDPCTTY